MDQLDFELTDEFCETLSRPMFGCIKLKPRGKKKDRRSSSTCKLIQGQSNNNNEEEKPNGNGNGHPQKTMTITPSVGRHLSMDFSNAQVGVFIDAVAAASSKPLDQNENESKQL